MAANREGLMISNTLASHLANFKATQWGITTTVVGHDETQWNLTNGLMSWMNSSNEVVVGAVQKYYTGGAWVRAGNVFADVAVDQLYTETGFRDQWLVADLTLSQNGTTALDALFDATSIVGALNELVNTWTRDGTDVILGNSGDQVGIGTTPKDSKLTVEGSVQLKEQAAADADTAAYLQIWVKTGTPNTLWYTDDLGVDHQVASVGTETAEMYMYEATNTVTITVTDTYYGIMGYSTGIVNGWTFDAGRVVDANITSEADNTVVRVVTSAAHLLTTGDIVSCRNMNNVAHDGITMVTVIDGTTFDCDDITYVAGAGASAGVIDEPSYLECGVGGAGTYDMQFGLSGEGSGSDSFKFELFINSTEQDKSAAEGDYAINDLEPVPGGQHQVIAVGDRVLLACKNKTGTNNFVMTHSNVRLHQV